MYKKFFSKFLTKIYIQIAVYFIHFFENKIYLFGLYTEFYIFSRLSPRTKICIISAKFLDDILKNASRTLGTRFTWKVLKPSRPT